MGNLGYNGEPLIQWRTLATMENPGYNGGTLDTMENPGYNGEPWLQWGTLDTIGEPWI